ncbi:hypothetical protein ACFL2H_14100 [Planctomycetota bacterium]
MSTFFSKPQPDKRVGFTQVSHSSIVSHLTGKQYRFPGNATARRKAIDQLTDEDSHILRAADARLKPQLGRAPTFDEVKQHLSGDLSIADDRSLIDRILEDGDVRTNEPTDDDLNGNAAAKAADLDNDKLYSTPARRAVRDKMKAKFQADHDERQAELEVQAAKEEREADPEWQRAQECAEIELRLRTVGTISGGHLGVAT